MLIKRHPKNDLPAKAGHFLYLIALCVGFAQIGFAQEAGVAEAKLLGQVMSGSIGTLVGLVAALIGLWVFLIQRSSWGLVMILLGVAVTLFPSIFEGVYNGFNPVVNESGGYRPDVELGLGR